jgi:hypothetical protein
MSDNETNQTFTFVVKDKKDQKAENGNIYEDYIIKSNQHLQTYNIELEKGVCKLESQIENIEDDIGKEEKRNEYLKDLLKNFNEIHSNMKELDSLQTQYYKKHTEYLYLYFVVLSICISILFSVMWYLIIVAVPAWSYVIWVKYNSSTRKILVKMNDLRAF